MQKALESRCRRHRKENGALAATHRMSDAFAPLARAAHLVGAQETEKWRGTRHTQAGASIKHYIERALSMRSVHMRRKAERRCQTSTHWMLEIERTRTKEKSLIYCLTADISIFDCSQNIIYSPRKFLSARCSTSGRPVLFRRRHLCACHPP